MKPTLSAKQQHWAVSYGNAMHATSIFLNLAMTGAIFLEYPSAASFDSLWKVRGQCHYENAFDTPYSTNVFCALALVVSGALLMASPSLVQLNQASQKQCHTTGMANLSHGLGHLALAFMGDAIPPIEFVWRADAVLYNIIVVLAGFWPTTLKQVVTQLTYSQAILMSAIVLAVQVGLNVPAHLSFTYSQSVVLMGQSIDQLLLQRKQRSDANYVPTDSSSAWTYVTFAAYYMPLFPLMWLETTECQSTLAEFGGHLPYDLYLSLVPFALLYVLNFQTNFRGSKTKQL